MLPNNMIQILSRFVPNIQQFQNVNTPDELAQKLLNSGKVNQSQVNQARQMWSRPDIRQIIQSKFRF